MPYFFSWVVIFGIFYSLFGSYGIVNTAITAMGGARIGFFTDNSVFRSVLVFTEGWKEVGYNTVIYLAAITGIDITLYEAARVDGASKWRQIWNITMPGLLPTIVLNGGTLKLTCNGNGNAAAPGCCQGDGRIRGLSGQGNHFPSHAATPAACPWPACCGAIRP